VVRARKRHRCRSIRVDRYGEGVGPNRIWLAIHRPTSVATPATSPELKAAQIRTRTTAIATPCTRHPSTRESRRPTMRATTSSTSSAKSRGRPPWLRPWRRPERRARPPSADEPRGRRAQPDEVGPAVGADASASNGRVPRQDG